MPESIDIEAAIAFANRRGYSNEQIQTIQRTTGSEASGHWEPSSIVALSAWQASIGLTPDGMAGPVTWRAVQRLAGVEAELGRELQPKLGVWVDDSPTTVLREGWLANLAGLGFSTIAVMVQRSTSAKSVAAWMPRWSAAQLTQLRQLAEPLALDIVLTTWPLPNKDQLAQLGAVMPALLEAAGAVGFEVDTEGNWDEGRLSGFADMREAAKALVATMQEAAKATQARLELTTYPYHPENSAQALVAPQMNRLFPQAYSVAERQGKAVAWDDRFGPDNMQKLSVHRAEAVPGVATTRVGLGLGLAAYDQEFAAHTPAEALGAALDAALELRVPELRYWSSRWIVGSSASPAVLGFFAARAQREPIQFGGDEPGEHDDAIEASRGAICEDAS